MFVSACYGNYMLTSRALQFCINLHVHCIPSYFPFEGWQLMNILSCHASMGQVSSCHSASDRAFAEGFLLQQ